MNLEGYAYWGASLIPAVGSFLLNVAIRGKAVFNSSGADWLLIIFAFDLTNVIGSTEIIKFIPDPEVKSAIGIIMTTSTIITLVIWISVIQHLEPILAQTTSNQRQIAKKIAGFAFVWLAILTLSAAHIYLFTYNKGV